MIIIFLSLLTIIHSYVVPNPRSSFIFNNKCFDKEYKIYRNIIYLKQNYSKNKIIKLNKENFKNNKFTIDEDEFSTEWDYYNQSWKK